MILPSHELFRQRQYERRPPKVSHPLERSRAPPPELHAVFPHGIPFAVRIDGSMIDGAPDAGPIVGVVMDAGAAEEYGEGGLVPGGDELGEFVGRVHDGFDGPCLLRGTLQLVHEQPVHGRTFLGFPRLLPVVVILPPAKAPAVRRRISPRHGLQERGVPQQSSCLLVLHEGQGLLSAQPVDGAGLQRALGFAPPRTVRHAIAQVIVRRPQQRKSLVIRQSVIVVMLLPPLLLPLLLQPRHRKDRLDQSQIHE
mmetsp:Transcript_15903/g.38210  ORF Transcript_15903/g.38210 Transcript_15903/m.38210 type:complete len:253 (-) Transcript_15903:238-996(-)